MPTQLSALCVSLLEGSGTLCLGGVSSFGYSGTIAHAALPFGGQLACRGGSSLADRAPRTAAAPRGSFGEEPEARAPAARLAVSFRRHLFPWSAPVHPLLQRCLEQGGTSVRFRSAAAARVRSLVADHVVYGRIVLPGAAYLEMARAAYWAAARSGVATTCLEAVFFLQPLAIEQGVDGASPSLECVLLDGSSFEVRSGDEWALERGDATLHCSGSASQATAPSSAEQAGAVARRSRCDRACGLASQYEGFHDVGLQYGPAFRLLHRAWAAFKRLGGGVSWRGAIAQLLRRRWSAGVLVHPAELDGALQLCAAAEPWEQLAAGETRLPFAVDRASLQVGALEAFAVRSHALACATWALHQTALLFAVVESGSRAAGCRAAFVAGRGCSIGGCQWSCGR